MTATSTHPMTHLTDVHGTEVWARGNIDLVDQIPYAITITGSHATTSYGDQVASDLGNWLTYADRTVINGGGFGIDAAALRGVLVAGGSPIVVMATGVDRVFPSAHATLYDTVLDAGGLLISLEKPRTAMTRTRALRRNTWLGTTTAGTVIVEARTRSAALVTARAADSAGRYLGAVPGPITSGASEGAHQLLQHTAAHLIFDQHTALNFAADAVDLAEGAQARRKARG